MRMLQSNYFSYVTNQCLCEHIDKYNLSPVLIVQNVPIVVRQQPEPNRFSMRSHSEQEQQHNLSLGSLAFNDPILCNNCICP